MNRFPPTLGVVGFDFGFKPAFSVAVLPLGAVVKQQEDDVPLTFCHDRLGDTLDGVVSGVSVCSGCFTTGAGDVKFSFTGVNGGATLAWDGVKWTVGIGTLTVEFYASVDGTCTGLTGTDSGILFLSAVCSGGNVFFVNIVATITGFDFTVFASNAGTAFGSPMNSTLVIGNCGSGSDPIVAGFGGTVTLALP